MSADSSAAASPNVFQQLDESGISRFQLKIMFVSGMGFFTDAYDLFVIGIVVALIKTQWSLSTSQVSWLNSATLLASAVGRPGLRPGGGHAGKETDLRLRGADPRGRGDRVGVRARRARFCLISRIILGIGIGGDYPVSATIMSEYSGKQNRGRDGRPGVRDAGPWA